MVNRAEKRSAFRHLVYVVANVMSVHWARNVLLEPAPAYGGRRYAFPPYDYDAAERCVVVSRFSPAACHHHEIPNFYPLDYSETLFLYPLIASYLSRLWSDN